MKVSYQYRWDEDGCVYNQCVSMKKTELLHLKLAMTDEVSKGFPRVEEYDPEGKNHAELFLKPIRLPNKDGLTFLNLTQRRFMELFLLEDVKAKIKDKNTCILIKE